MDKPLNSRELLKTISIFLLVFSIDNKKYPKGKRLRKKIYMALKKKIAISREQFKNDVFMDLINKCYKLISDTSDSMKLDSGKLTNVSICVYTLLVNIEKSDPGFFKRNLIEQQDIDDLGKEYGDTNLKFVTLMFTNRFNKILSEVKI